MSNRPDGGRVVITGASAGIGRAVARAFARRGWAVAGIARGRRGLEGTKKDIEKTGGLALMIAADVADPAAIAAAAQDVVAAWGGIDVWVNNAMVTIFAPTWQIAPAEFKRVTEVTYLGQVYGTLAALTHMRRQQSGTIVQIGSALAYRSIPLQSAYCAAKAASRGFTDSLRSELLHERSPIRLTSVHLPAVNTPQFNWARSRLAQRPQPVAPIHDPEIAAEAIYQAARDAPREVWVGAATLEAVLGTMVAPGLLDHLLASRAWKGQMSAEPAVETPDNLFEPVDEDQGAHGRFRPLEKHSALIASATFLRGATVAGAATFAAGLFFVLRRSAR